MYYAISNELNKDIQKERHIGKDLFFKNKAKAIFMSATLIQIDVDDLKQVKTIEFSIDKSTNCSCVEFFKLGECRHVVAATHLAEKTGYLKEFQRKKAYTKGTKLLTAMEDSFHHGDHIQLEVTIFIKHISNKIIYSCGLRVGEEKLYVVRDIEKFLDAKKSKRALIFGKSFTYQPSWMRFSKTDEEILQIFEYILHNRNINANEEYKLLPRVIELPENFLKLLLNSLQNSFFRIFLEGDILEQNRISEKAINIKYIVKTDPIGITIKADWKNNILLLTRDGQFVLEDNKVYRLYETQRKILPIFLESKIENTACFAFEDGKYQNIMNELVPWLSATGNVFVDEKLQKKLIKEPLESKIYLDREGKNITGKVLFKYGEYEINPFLPIETEGYKEQFLLRDIKKERQIINKLEKFGFRVKTGSIYIRDEESIYVFLSEGVEQLNLISEVFASKQFKNTIPRKPSFNINMKSKGSLLEISFFEEEEPSKEILDILRAIRQNREYFRLRDGSFIDLKTLEKWDDVAEELIDGLSTSRKISSNTITLHNYRTHYLNKLFQNLKVDTKKDEKTTNILQALSNTNTAVIPKGIKAKLRCYQKRGLRWIQELWKLKMGGVLADEMGLGKTLQVIAFVMWMKENKIEKPILVITPSSLCYNWQAEIQRYAPSLTTTLIQGGQDKRRTEVEKLKEKKESFDIIITSYPLIRRDVDMMEGIDFSLIVLDEAQYIKNPNSVSFSAVKQLEGDMRLALSGTPMENHIGELWTVMDFVLPGYLGNLNSFLREYGEGENIEKLKEKISPFLLRRLKKDVLQELPYKTETTILAQMPLDQERVYKAALIRVRDKVGKYLNAEGENQGRIEILAAITELRQISCHPQLILPEYMGGSGKLELLLDLVPNMIKNEHRILIFSQFTKMLKIIKKHLENINISLFYLDGETKPFQRQELVDKFNEGEVSVFLISLKAGGTGLNLTAADKVIHFDPWWNPATEDQATDRVHRIGQKNTVEVIKLITHNSIEEQVAKLSKKKRHLFEQLITAGERMPATLSREDIESLFK